jgi:hypothetical protein
MAGLSTANQKFRARTDAYADVAEANPQILVDANQPCVKQRFAPTAKIVDFNECRQVAAMPVDGELCVALIDGH